MFFALLRNMLVILFFSLAKRAVAFLRCHAPGDDAGLVFANEPGRRNEVRTGLTLIAFATARSITSGLFAGKFSCKQEDGTRHVAVPGPFVMPRTLTLLFSFSLLFVSNGANSQEPSGDALDQQVYWILKNKCAKCHDDLGHNAASGEGDLLNLEGIAAVRYIDLP